MRRRSDITSIALAIAAVLAPGTVMAEPSAVGSADFVPPTHPMYKANDVTVREQLGTRVPLDATFRTQDGKQVTLGEVLAGELPTILTFNYSDCPMLCSLQLNGLSAALPKVAVPATLAGLGQVDTQVKLGLGSQFRVVTIDLEPSESLAKMAKMRERYLARVDHLLEEQGDASDATREAARAGWTFLVAATPGIDTDIRRVANAVGFDYAYVEARAEWAHPAALIFLSTTGTVTRYVYGIEFETQILRESIVKAGLAEAATAVGFMNRCYHFDPAASSSARAGVLALRLGAVGFLVLLVSGLGVFHVLRRRRAPGET